MTNFQLIREEHIPEFNSQAKLYRHETTGAEVLSLENDDENKCFGITFRTPPQDSTGVAHILEHSVLCGSRKYPLKEPFIEMAKGSLKTFLNAFTYPDKTCYPVASTNLQDFYNLVDVYLDAVFYPNLTPYTLAQEGWHYEIDETDAPLAFKGVVFNEMKGNYSSPDSVLGEYTQQSLYPDNEYGVDSGGDPRHIPDLTFEQLSEFHSRLYHPSNSRIFFYGDDDPQKRLQILDEWLSAFEKIDPQSDVHFQPRWETPRHQIKTYATGEDSDGKSYITVSWLLDEPLTMDEALARQMLSYILLSTPASPLRKKLIDSSLGENVTGGINDSLRQPFFTAGLKGIQVENADQVEFLITDTLRDLAQNGIDPEMIEAAVNTIEFHLRENNQGGFPRGLALMLWSLDTWLHDKDPIEPLRFEAPLQNLKKRLQSERVFEDMIQREILDNAHRSTVVLKPDPELAARVEADEKGRLTAARALLREDDIQKLILDTQELKRRQETPDPPEVLALIPGLKLEDLDKKNKITPKEEKQLADVPVLHTPLFTNGIIYADIGFNLHNVPQELLPYVSLFGRALTQIGTEKEDFVRLTQRIGQKTGGIGAQSVVTARSDSNAASPPTVAWLFLRGKVVPEHAQDMLDIWRDVLLTVRLDDKERFKQMALEEKAALESRLVPAGHGITATRLRAHFSEEGRLGEAMSGVSYLFFLRELCEKIEHKWPEVLHALESLRSHWLNRGGAFGHVTADENLYSEFAPRFEEFISSLPGHDPVPAVWDFPSPPRGEGLTIPAQVNFVAKGANLFELGYEKHGSASVIRNYLNTTWLWERVRMRGGAYGGFCGFDRTTGVFSFGSYRDPNLLKTLDVYDATAEFLREAQIDDGALTRSTIGVISDMDFYRLPDAKGWGSLVHYLAGDTEEERQEWRDQVLSTKSSDFLAFADTLEKAAHSSHVVVMGSPDAIATANEEKPGLLEVTKVL